MIAKLQRKNNTSIVSKQFRKRFYATDKSRSAWVFPKKIEELSLTNKKSL
jgi:hypothetical protein